MAASTIGSSSRLGLLLPPLAFVLLVFAASSELALASVAPGLVFHVGGPRGWRVPDANTSYGWWAMNNRFHVGDALYFKYENDSVLLVDREDFDACNATEPIARSDDGSTKVPLDRPGFFCFISGQPGHCEDGQKLVVRVMVHPAADPAPAPGPDVAYAPGTSQQPGQGGSGSGGGHGGSQPGGTSSANAAVAVGGIALAVAVAVGIVLLFQ